MFAVSPRGLFVASALAAGTLAATGCATSRFAVDRVMVPVLDNARDVAFASDDVRTFRDGAAANLFLLEGLIETSPDEPALRIDAAMLYFAYAFAFIETDDPGYASLLYRKGWRHGQAALSHHRALRDIFEAPFDDFRSALSRLDKRDVPAAVWTAVNWAQFINIHLDSTAVLRDIPKVTALLDRVVELDDGYFDGLVYVMSGTLSAFKPPIMGGDPEASRENFETAFRIGGDGFLLSRYFFARYYCYRIQDAALFESTLRGVIDAPDETDHPYRLLNLIARKKSRRLLGEIDDLF